MEAASTTVPSRRWPPWLRLAIFFGIGFVVQFGAAGVAFNLGSSVPEALREFAFYALMPGLMLFWPQGIHTGGSLWLTLVPGLIVDGAYFGAVTAGVVRGGRLIRRRLHQR
jgi:hypothetical protein